MPTVDYRKHALHTAFLDAKKTFDHLCDSLDDQAWKQKFPDKPYKVGEVMMQITSSLSFIPQVVKDIRRGKGFTPPPGFVMALIRFFFKGFAGRDLTQQEIKASYDAAHKIVLEVLNGIKEDEWQKKAKFFGEYETIEQVFRRYLQSFHEDTGNIGLIIKH